MLKYWFCRCDVGLAHGDALLLLIRKFTVGATIGRPRAFDERPYKQIGRELVFSSDLCYNRVNKKPPSEMPSASGCGGTQSVTEGACVTLGLC